MSRPAQKSASGTMPADIAAKIRAIGPVIDPPATAAVYTPLHPREPYAGVKVTRDIKYGGDDRHALDVFAPEGASGLPVLIFIHGGGYTGGHKREGDNFFYDNIMLWAARHGMVGVNATYRLAPQSPYPAAAEDLAAIVAWVAGKIGERGGDPAPQAPWPAGAEDVAGAVRWTVENIAKFGGDPKRIFLAGHSAGGTHVGTYVAQERFHQPDGTALAGLILISGNYDLSKVPADRFPSVADFARALDTAPAHAGSGASSANTSPHNNAIGPDSDSTPFGVRDTRGSSACSAKNCSTASDANSTPNTS